MYPKKCVSLTIPNILSDDRETRILTKKDRNDRSFFPPIAIVPATEPAPSLYYLSRTKKRSSKRRQKVDFITKSPPLKMCPHSQ